jgi:predicted nucleotidyltransferase
MISPSTRTEILKRLKQVEREHHVRVLYAVESGSRAWGFASEDSDYDVRFVYAHPEAWYLSIDAFEARDVIEYPIVDEIDLAGWDLRKALRLLRKSNPGIVEWLQSPIVYMDEGSFADRARVLLPECYSPLSGLHHYRSMAQTNARGIFEAEAIKVKKIFYVLRPILAARWLEKFQTAPPMEFERLLPLLGDAADLNASIQDLLRKKRDATEKAQMPPPKVVLRFLEEGLRRLSDLALGTAPELPSTDVLNDLFRSVLREAP